MCVWVGTGDMELFLRVLHLEEPNYQEQKAELCEEGIHRRQVGWGGERSLGCMGTLSSSLHVCQPSLT